MKRVFTVVLLLSIVSAGAYGGTFVVTLPAAGSYGARTFDIDFGQSFASIQSLTITWSGHVTPGWWSDLLNSGPWGGQFLAYLRTDGGATAKWAATPGMGVSTYPSPQYFGLTTAFGPYAGYQPWGFLLDGRAAVRIEFAPSIHIYGGEGTPGWPPWPPPGSLPPVGWLDSATLTLEATPVPEPGALLCLSLGLLACSGRIVRRARRM